MEERCTRPPLDVAGNGVTSFRLSEQVFAVLRIIGVLVRRKENAQCSDLKK